MSRIACIGSRETPPSVLSWMTNAGRVLALEGHTIVSGNAPGADQAWARGVNAVEPRKVELRLPWDEFEYRAIVAGNVLHVGADADARELAAKLHIRWASLHSGAQALLARDVMIVRDAAAVLGWPNRAKLGGGGTGFAFKVARHLKVPVYDVSILPIRSAFDEAATKGAVFP